MVFWDITIIQILQMLLPYVAWDLLNQIGTDIIYLGLLGIALWCVNKREAKIAIHLLLFSNFFNIILKYAFHMSRPPVELRHDPEYAADTSYGFPSGMTQSATTFWGWASLKLRRWFVWVVSTILIIIGALARVGLGLHWLGDVIGGVIIGIVIVTMAYFLVPFFLRQWQRMSRLLQESLFPLLALIFFGIFSIAYAFGLPYFPTENIALSMGALFGFSTGAVLETRYIAYSTDVDRNTKIIRAVIGLLLALILYYTFTYAFNLFGVGGIFTVRFIKYALIGFFAAFVIPLLFKVIGR